MKQSDTRPPLDEAEREKRSAALSSVIAAVALTGMKLVVGLITNSLGILSEALHSGLDLMAAALTYFAVRFASIPPDPGHPYGHGKIENLSALAESLLLFMTCGWIIWEASDRLFFNPVPVSPSLWAVGVMVVSIVVDISRSRMLKRMAKKHRSQALEADALHFSTDILSSAVVLVGIGALYLAEALPAGSPLRPWLERADSLAALGVAAIVVHVSWALGKRAVNVLLDAGDAGLSASVHEALAALPPVRQVHSVRLRHSGPDMFVEVSVGVDSALVLEETRQVKAAVASAVRAIVEHAAVGVELVPESAGQGDRVAGLRSLAAAQGLAPHAVELMEVEDEVGRGRRMLLEMHMEVPGEMPLAAAYARVEAFEERVRRENPGAVLVTHLEPKGEEAVASKAVLLDERHIVEAARELVLEEPLVTDCHDVIFRACGDALVVSFHCRMPGNTAVADAHAVSTRLQTALHRRMPELSRVIVHVEPQGDTIECEG